MESVESVPRLTPLLSCQTRYTSFRSISDSGRRRSPVARSFVTLTGDTLLILLNVQPEAVRVVLPGSHPGFGWESWCTP